MDTFKELNTDLEQSLKDIQKASKSDKKQIQVLESKIDELEKDVDQSAQKCRNLVKSHNDKLDQEASAHSSTKSDLRYAPTII